MGVKAGNVYGLGVQLGICSFFASRGDTSNAKKGLGFALNNVNALVAQGVGLNANELNQAKANPTQSKLEALRGDYRDTLSSTKYLHLFDFAVGVGLAEGQSSVPDAAAHVLAKEALTNAGTHEKNLLGYGLVPVTDKHDVIQVFREAWQERFSASAFG
jgi:hypothetical protein